MVRGLNNAHILRFGTSIKGYSTIHGDLIDLYTGNYMYHFLKDCALPLSKTYLGNFNFAASQSLLLDLSVYKKYFTEGTLDVYQTLRKKTIFLPTTNRADNLGVPFFEWYKSWFNLDQFKIFRHFYFHLDTDTPSRVNLFQIAKNSFPHSSMLLDDIDWVTLCDSLTFSTIDFVENQDRLLLSSVNPDIWSKIYTLEQAMFRYYQPTTGVIGFWTPADLFLNYEIQRIASLLEKKPEEVLAIFSSWLSPISPPNTLFFNYINTESYDWNQWPMS